MERNQMAHEMDVELSQPNRTRRARAKQDLVNDTNEVFRVANVFLVEVESRLRSATV
jgi:hypothetical protein